jgi:hypothetical protein
MNKACENPGVIFSNLLPEVILEIRSSPVKSVKRNRVLTGRLRVLSHLRMLRTSDGTLHSFKARPGRGS